jgi:hypothetical protein
LEGYVLIPHELLHVWAYRLVGQPCWYRWGDTQVTPMRRLSRRERLFVLLWPFGLTLGVGLGLLLLWLGLQVNWLVTLRGAVNSDREYWVAIPQWHWLISIASFLLTAYAGVGWFDVVGASRLLFGKPPASEEHHSQED